MTEQTGPRWIAFQFDNATNPVCYVAERQPDGTYRECATAKGGIENAKALADALNDREDLKRLEHEVGES
jgi:hypothetical protein